MRIIPLIVLLACLAWPANARAQDEGEARVAPSRGLLKRGLLAKGKPTTTTTPAPQEETEYEDEAEYVDEAQEPSTEAPPSSTEGKKLVAGGVRPFRSNADLLEALKRRRAQAAEAKLHGQSQVPVAAPAQEAPVEPTPVKSSYTVPVKKKLDLSKSQSSNTLIGSRVTLPCLNRRRSLDKETSSTTRGDETKSIASEEYSTEKRHINTTMIKKRTRMYQKVRENTNMAASFQESGREKGKKRFNTPAKESKTEEAAGPVKPGRGRFGRPSSRAVQEESEEQNESAPAPIRTGRTFRRGN